MWTIQSSILQLHRNNHYKKRKKTSLIYPVFHFLFCSLYHTRSFNSLPNKSFLSSRTSYHRPLPHLICLPSLNPALLPIPSYSGDILCIAIPRKFFTYVVWNRYFFIVIIYRLKTVLFRFSNIQTKRNLVYRINKEISVRPFFSLFNHFEPGKFLLHLEKI